MAEKLFPEFQTLGEMPVRDAVVILRDMGDRAVADEIEEYVASPDNSSTPEDPIGMLGAPVKDRSFWDWFLDRPPAYQEVWRYTQHTYGHIAAGQSEEDELIPIQHAGTIAADESLRGQPIKVTLDRLRAADYPGSGIHRVMVDFYAEHQATEVTEKLHFTQTYRVLEEQDAGVIGFPIFIGLGVGNEGVSFKVFTVNVKNDDDEAVLNFLDSDVFNSGLKLIKTANPAIAPLTGLASGLVKLVAGRNKNVAVQDFYMGLDFTKVRTGARLAEGSYIAVQIPEGVAWDWSDWRYDTSSGVVVSVSDRAKAIPLNYLIFGVSRLHKPT
jgi:hypothetical protein